MKIISWNVNGLQGLLKKDQKGQKTTTFQSSEISGSSNILDHLIKSEDPDILCLQEIRCPETFINSSICSQTLFGCVYRNCSILRKGYSGTLICSKVMPLSIKMNFEEFPVQSAPILQSEARIITLKYHDFYLVNVYVPNSGNEFARLQSRIELWEATLRKYLNYLQATKPIILVGDLNCTPGSKDIYNSQKIMPGNHPLERQAFRQLISNCHLVDSFRHLYPVRRKYSWLYPASQDGMRLDFLLISNSLKQDLVESDILPYPGSDHLPVTLTLNHINPKLKLRQSQDGLIRRV